LELTDTIPAVACAAVWAQAAVTDPISGGAGWVGAGLLGLVLGWLMFIHLPAKDKQLKELIDVKDKQIKDLIDDKDKALTEIVKAKDDRIKEVMDAKDSRMHRLSEDFRGALDKVVEHCKEESEKLAERFSGELAAIRLEVQRPITDIFNKMTGSAAGIKKADH
jgi:gas vesicle protein